MTTDHIEQQPQAYANRRWTIVIRWNFYIALLSLAVASLMFGLLTDSWAGLGFFLAVPSMAAEGNWWAIWFSGSLMAWIGLRFTDWWLRASTQS